MVWEAAKTATVYALLGVLLGVAVTMVMCAGIGLGKLVSYMEGRLRPWQIGALMAAFALAAVWVVVFASTLCCGVPIR